MIGLEQVSRIPDFHVIVEFGSGIPSDEQGIALLLLEKTLRERGIPAVVLKPTKPDDSKLRSKMKLKVKQFYHLWGKAGKLDNDVLQSDVRTVERAIALGMNTHPPFYGLNLGMAHIITGSAAIAADTDVMLCDFRCQPTSYESDI